MGCRRVSSTNITELLALVNFKTILCWDKLMFSFGRLGVDSLVWQVLAQVEQEPSCWLGEWRPWQLLPDRQLSDTLQEWRQLTWPGCTASAWGHWWRSRPLRSLHSHWILSGKNISILLRSILPCFLTDFSTPWELKNCILRSGHFFNS